MLRKQRSLRRQAVVCTQNQPVREAQAVARAVDIQLGVGAKRQAFVEQVVPQAAQELTCLAAGTRATVFIGHAQSTIDIEAVGAPGTQHFGHVTLGIAHLVVLGVSFRLDVELVGHFDLDIGTDLAGARFRSCLLAQTKTSVLLARVGACRHLTVVVRELDDGRIATLRAGCRNPLTLR